jgi:hypothetical protein
MFTVLSRQRGTGEWQALRCHTLLSTPKSAANLSYASHTMYVNCKTGLQADSTCGGVIVWTSHHQRRIKADHVVGYLFG